MIVLLRMSDHSQSIDYPYIEDDNLQTVSLFVPIPSPSEYSSINDEGKQPDRFCSVYNQLVAIDRLSIARLADDSDLRMGLS